MALGNNNSGKKGSGSRSNSRGLGSKRPTTQELARRKPGGMRGASKLERNPSTGRVQPKGTFNQAAKQAHLEKLRAAQPAQRSLPIGKVLRIGGRASGVAGALSMMVEPVPPQSPEQRRYRPRPCPVHTRITRYRSQTAGISQRRCGDRAANKRGILRTRPYYDDLLILPRVRREGGGRLPKDWGERNQISRFLSRLTGIADGDPNTGPEKFLQ